MLQTQNKSPAIAHSWITGTYCSIDMASFLWDSICAILAHHLLNKQSLEHNQVKLQQNAPPMIVNVVKTSKINVFLSFLDAVFHTFMCLCSVKALNSKASVFQHKLGNSHIIIMFFLTLFVFYNKTAYICDEIRHYTHYIHYINSLKIVLLWRNLCVF